MQFTIINLEELSVSEKDKELLKKFKSFRDESIQPLQKANAYYDEIPKQFIGLRGKSSASYKNDLKQHLEKSDAQQFHQEITLYKQDIYKQKMHEWYVVQNKGLLEDETWENLAESCRDSVDKIKIQSLKKEWMRHANFSHYPSQALVEVASRYIVLFEAYSTLLKVEFSKYKNKLSSTLQQEIESYIKALNSAIEKEKAKVAYAMLARLKIASHTRDIKYDDVTIHLTHSLKKMNVLNKALNLPIRRRRDLDGRTRDYFQTFILKNGTYEQKQVLKKLIWNVSDKDYRVIENKKRFFALPKVLEKPFHKKGFLHRLFGIDKQNEKFIHERFSLLTRLRFPPKPEKKFKSLPTFLENDSWRDLYSLSCDVIIEYEGPDGPKPLTLFEKLFMKDRWTFAASWKMYLRGQQQSIVHSMLTYADYVAKEMKRYVDLGLGLEVLCTEQFQSDIQHFNNDIWIAIGRAGLDKDKLPLYQHFLLQFNRITHLPKELEEANKKQKQQEEKRRQERSKIPVIGKFFNWSSAEVDKMKDARAYLDPEKINIDSSHDFEIPYLLNPEPLPTDLKRKIVDLVPPHLKKQMGARAEDAKEPKKGPVPYLDLEKIGIDLSPCDSDIPYVLGHPISTERLTHEKERGIDAKGQAKEVEKAKNEFNHFKPTTDDLKSILIKLISKKGELDYKNESFKRDVSRLASYLTTFNLNKDRLPLFHGKLEAVLKQFFKAYLITWLNSKEEEKENLAHSLSSLELSFYQLAPPFMKERIEDLISSRKNQDWFVFQGICCSMLAGLDSTLGDHYLSKVADLLSKPVSNQSADRSESFNNPFYQDSSDTYQDENHFPSYGPY